VLAGALLSTAKSFYAICVATGRARSTVRARR
jgi:hypothetical protein